MTQRPILRLVVYARALCTNLNKNKFFLRLFLYRKSVVKVKVKVVRITSSIQHELSFALDNGHAKNRT
jgi:hypothetical protein